ncbi:MAG: DUF1122 family protein [Actinomycetota bacterium]
MAGPFVTPTDVLVDSLNGRKLGVIVLEARDFRRGRTDRETYFNLYAWKEGTLSRRPLVQGLFFMGRGEHIKPWMEFRYDPLASFPGGGELDLEVAGLSGELFELLGSLVPPGGSLMVIYGAEPHPLARETENGLKRDFPPMVTPLGHYLWKAGFRWFKDWYFPEGWMEGAMKLQATRPLDERTRARREAEAKRALEQFIAGARDQGSSDPEKERALSRAEEILASL